MLSNFISTNSFSQTETRKSRRRRRRMESTAIFIFRFLLLTLSTTTMASSTSNSLLRASDILSDSGYLSMALTLRITTDNLNLQSLSITIFAPSDSAFLRYGQLSLQDLQYHISPSRLSIESFKNLSYGSIIPTLSSHRSLIVTLNSHFDDQFSINGVSLKGSLLFDDANVVIYGIDDFLSSFSAPPTQHTVNASTSSPPPPQSPNSSPLPSPNSSPTSLPPPLLQNPEFSTSLPEQSPNTSTLYVDNHFEKASGSLTSNGGYSIMAAFLQAQLLTNQTRLTMFAPIDEAIKAYTNNISDYSLIFKQHVIPMFVPGRDMIKLDDGRILSTFSQGFSITVTRSGDVVVLNGIPVIHLDMYCGDSIVVHGINRLLISANQQGLLIGDSFSALDGGESKVQSDYCEYDAP